ncbi:MAG: hypothetical protein JWQ35_1180 [Bacteriovoracaceae bacterium]|nr:hypothetical protein [Bacteriovoracaceae bacterium]
MSQIFEKKWFRLAVIGGSSFILFGVVTTFFLKAHFEQVERDAEAEARLEAERDYEDRFRSAMTRIYQNLKLEHYLAAYKNLEYLPEPKRSDRVKVDEYLEVLNRVGNGLLQNQLLKESESVFYTIRSFEGQISTANLALSKIESKRRVDNAKFFFAQGEHLLAEKRYREAKNEFDKTQLELHSVEILHFDDVKEQTAKLQPKLKEARFYTFLDDADETLKKVEPLFKDKKFKQADEAIAQAAIKVGQAAFLKGDSPEVRARRLRIADLEGELGYLIPNAVPIWNNYSKEDQETKPNYFNLVGYELGSALNAEGQIKIALQYLMSRTCKYFVVRYRITFFGGRNIFNGHFIMTDSTLPIDKTRSITYLQEIPDDLRKTQIERIEVRIYDEDAQIVSRVTRAFRKTG